MQMLINAHIVSPPLRTLDMNGPVRCSGSALTFPPLWGKKLWNLSSSCGLGWA